MKKTPKPEKLRRIKAGEYQTTDGLFTILLDPSGVEKTGPDCWLLFHEKNPKDGTLGRYPTLGVARRSLPFWRVETVR